MRVVELFAGAGGAALGLEAAGFEHLACIEWGEDACATLRAAGLPAVEGDVRDPDLYESEWVGCDLLWSSFPCQAWSSAGDRLGPKDERNGWPWTVDAIDCLEPRWFAAENVTGLLQHKGACEDGCLGPDLCPRAYFDRVILAQLRERFESVQYRVLNASSFGVPQHRRRVIIVAGPGPMQWPEPTHGKPTDQTDLFGRKLLRWATIRGALGVEGGRVIGGGSNPRASGESESRSYRDISEEPSTTVAAVQIGNAWPWIVEGQGASALDCPAPTVCAGPGGKGTGQWSANQKDREALEVESGRRRLTVEDCATLQDFPADHPFQGTKTSRYTQIGNAVPPKLAEVVGRAIMRAQKENER